METITTIPTDKAIYEMYIAGGEAIAKITQIKGARSIKLKANDLLVVLNSGTTQYIKTVDGTFVKAHFNHHNKHLHMHGEYINTYLTKEMILSQLKKELSDLVLATYPTEGDLSW